MILDRVHRRWFRFSVLFLLATAVLYVAYASRAPDGPAGGSAWGLAFGIIGTAFILFAALLGVRKRRPHYRWGRAAWWLKGHLWLGALSFPLILFHGGFAFGGAVTQVLMWLFVLVFVTGIIGLAIQQVLPRLMSKNVSQETVYEQIDHVRELLFNEAEQLAKGDAKGGRAVSRAKSGGKVQGRVVESRAVVEVEAADEGDATEEEGPPPVDERAPLKRFVDQDLRRFFAKDGARGSVLLEEQRRAAVFHELKQKLDPKLHAVADDLSALCETRSQLHLQRRLHHWLHGWLLIHVPLSWTMILLTAVHAVMSLYY